MSFVTKIISVVIKSVAGNKTSNGLFKELIDVVIDEGSEMDISKIKFFVDDEKDNFNRIFSENNMQSMNIPIQNIGYVVSEIKDLLSDIDITNDVFRKCKYNEENLRDYLWHQYLRKRNNHVECESDIKRCLFDVAKELIELLKKSEDFEQGILIHISNSVDNILLEEQNNILHIMKRFDKMEEDTRAFLDRTGENSGVRENNVHQKERKNRVQEYADKWKSNMFLNDFDKRDENAGVNVKLGETYLDEHLPHYIWGNNKKSRSDLKQLLSEYIYEYSENKMLLVLGQPGIGKSTLITWITANFSCSNDRILVYKFATDLNSIDWKNTQKDIVDEILKTLNISYDMLYGKILILDGFDEVNIGGFGGQVLNEIYRKLVKNISWYKVSVIITCRENYIDEMQEAEYDYITLQPWDEKQIRSFYRIFQTKTKMKMPAHTIENVIRNQGILGIPLILYMVLALNISIEKEGSIVDVYDHIFSLKKSGIYDKCINNKSFDISHRISKIKKQIHQITREIAIWMFENNPEKASIPKEEYEKICVAVGKEQKGESIQHDFLIGNYFKAIKHCEGIETETLYFVHRSIYEYFVAETIYSSIENAILKLTEKSQKEFVKKLAIYLKQGQITNTIGEYLQFKILKLYNRLDCTKKVHFYPWLENAIEKMVDKGMFYYSGENITKYENIMDKEIQCFFNIIKILRLVMDTGKSEYILEYANREKLEKYIRFGLVACKIEKKYGMEVFDLSKMSLEHINLSNIDLKRANLQMVNLSHANLYETDLSGLNLRYVNLKGADLRNANLKSADLLGVDLEGAYLSKTDFRKAKLEKAKLTKTSLLQANFVGARLEGVDFDETDLVEAIFDVDQIMYLEKNYKKYNLKGVMVYINDIDNVVYEEYCKIVNDIVQEKKLDKDQITPNMVFDALSKLNINRETK